MSDPFAEYRRRVRLLERAGDVERLRFRDLLIDGERYEETDPERSFAVFTQGRDEAVRLRDTWWDLFECRRLNALVCWLGDSARALPLAMRLLVRFNSEEGQSHTDRTIVLQNAVCTFVCIDPFGYRDDIERVFAYLDGLTDTGPVPLRFILEHRRAEYLASTERWDEAYELCLRSMALVDRSPSPVFRAWHGAWILYQLCRICHTLKRGDELAAHAEHLGELSDQHHHLRRTLADATLWKAVSLRGKGDEQNASRYFHKGMSILAGLNSRDTICADPIAVYYEMCGDIRAAVAVRDRQLADVTRRGQLHGACEVHVERCRLLGQSRELGPADLIEGRLAANKLRNPARFLEKFDRLEATGKLEA